MLLKNRPRIVLYWYSASAAFCMRMYTLLKVVCCYDLRVLSMSLVGLKKLG